MDEHGAWIEATKLVGGRLCLDFANTVGSHGTEHPDEHLSSYGDLLLWSRRVGTLSAEAFVELARAAEQRPDEAALIFGRAYALREVIYRVFSAVAAAQRAADTDLGQLNRMLQEALAHAELAQQDAGFAWGWRAEGDALEQVIWPIVRSAADLLTSGELGRVRECSGETCGWLFVDTSRNRSRRWCDMEDCGNRAKARRHYQRQRAAE